MASWAPDEQRSKAHWSPGGGRVSIEQRVAGTWTLSVVRDGVVIHRRAGIPSEAEAHVRAGVWVDQLGYTLGSR